MLWWRKKAFSLSGAQFNSLRVRSCILWQLSVNTQAVHTVSEFIEDATFPCMLGATLSIDSLKDRSSSAWVSVQWLSMAPGWHSPLLGFSVSLENSSHFALDLLLRQARFGGVSSLPCMVYGRRGGEQ